MKDSSQRKRNGVHEAVVKRLDVSGSRNPQGIRHCPTKIKASFRRVYMSSNRLHLSELDHTFPACIAPLIRLHLDFYKGEKPGPHAHSKPSVNNLDILVHQMAFK